MLLLCFNVINADSFPQNSDYVGPPGLDSLNLATVGDLELANIGLRRGSTQAISLIDGARDTYTDETSTNSFSDTPLSSARVTLDSGDPASNGQRNQIDSPGKEQSPLAPWACVSGKNPSCCVGKIIHRGLGIGRRNLEARSFTVSGCRACEFYISI